MKRVSFDFDGTLTEQRVLQFAKKLRDEGYELWITTLRHSDENMAALGIKTFYNNEKLFKIAKQLGIKTNHIQFCNETGYKLEYLIDKDFRFHLDDDRYIIHSIGQHLPHIIVDCYDPDWRTQCLERLVD